MKRTHYILVTGIILLMAVLTTPRAVQAVLGGSADSVTADQKALAAMRSVTTIHANYSVQQVESDAVTVREYISSSDIVFAVVWSGLVNPDLTQLLGSYSDEYREAQRQMPRTHGKRTQQVKASHVVVETWGHMRHLQGRAYVPALVPQGVTIDEIK